MAMFRKIPEDIGGTGWVPELTPLGSKLFLRAIFLAGREVSQVYHCGEWVQIGFGEWLMSKAELVGKAGFNNIKTLEKAMAELGPQGVKFLGWRRATLHQNAKTLFSIHPPEAFLLEKESRKGGLKNNPPPYDGGLENTIPNPVGWVTESPTQPSWVGQDLPHPTQLGGSKTNPPYIRARGATEPKPKPKPEYVPQDLDPMGVPGDRAAVSDPLQAGGEEQRGQAETEIVNVNANEPEPVTQTANEPVRLHQDVTTADLMQMARPETVLASGLTMQEMRSRIRAQFQEGKNGSA